MGKIIYLGHYSDLTSDRKNSPAAVNVMSYVIESANKRGYGLTVVSPVQKCGDVMSGREVQQVNEKTVCIYTPTLKKAARWNIPYRALQKFRREWNLRKELERTVEDGDTLLVYHSLSLMDAVRWIRGKKRIQLILQVCEVYADAEVTISAARRHKEIEYIETADRYIFMSDMMAKMLSNRKKYAVCLGCCQSVQPCNKKEREKVHVVYAGTLDSVKGGCVNAVLAAAYLNEDYHIHILGTGSKQQVDDLQLLIADVSQRTNAKITYDGLMVGSAYTEFLKNCDIGLSTQNPEKEFNATSFPSKILSYLSHGLRVLSAKIPVIEESAIGEYLFYYKENNPEHIAKAIMAIDMSQPYNSYEIVKKLDREFCEKLKELLS